MTATEPNAMLPAVRDNTPVFTESQGFEYDGAWYFVENNKLYNLKHEVAVVYSPGYGGGWTTWRREIDPMDARVAILTLTGGAAKLVFKGYDEDDEQAVFFANSKFSMYRENDRTNDLAIEWLPAGTLYQIDEYDGFESVRTNKATDWKIA